MSKIAVSDSACLIGLERIGRLDILSQSFETVFIPPAVQNEFGYSFDWLVVKPLQNTDMARALQTQIDEGESEAITLAVELGNVLVVLDDKKARRIARQMDLKIIGTVGLLLRAKKKGIISEVKATLDALYDVDFRISDSLYKQALNLADES